VPLQASEHLGQPAAAKMLGHHICHDSDRRIKLDVSAVSIVWLWGALH
jgi:hypothetical protein